MLARPALDLRDGVRPCHVGVAACLLGVAGTSQYSSMYARADAYPMSGHYARAAKDAPEQLLGCLRQAHQVSKHTTNDLSHTHQCVLTHATIHVMMQVMHHVMIHVMMQIVVRLATPSESPTTSTNATAMTQC